MDGDNGVQGEAGTDGSDGIDVSSPILFLTFVRVNIKTVSENIIGYCKNNI